METLSDVNLNKMSKKAILDANSCAAMARALLLLALLPWSGLSLSLGRTWARRGPLATGGRRAWSAPRHRVAARSEDGGGGRRATLKERIAQARAELDEKSAAKGAGAGGGAGGGAEAPKGLLAMLQGEPKEPEPPAPNDVGLRRVSYHFQLMRMLTSNAILLSLFMKMIAERNADTMPRLVAASALYTSWLWRLVSCGYVYEARVWANANRLGRVASTPPPSLPSTTRAYGRARTKPSGRGSGGARVSRRATA